MLLRYILTLALILFHSNSYSDPFTNEIGIIKEPEVVEIKIEETTEPETDLIVEEDVATDLEITEELFDNTDEVTEVVEAEPESTELLTILIQLLHTH